MTPAVTVIVPVMRRPQNADRFMTSLQASTDRADVLVVADEDDNETWRAWLQAMPKGAGRVVRSAWPAPGGTFPEKVNLGFRMLPWTTKWIFIVGDDVRFGEGWLEAALAEATDTTHVVGTHAPNASDVWSPHLLIRRRYVVEQGASWDGPGVVCHEGYRHSYVDAEICRVARVRGVWAMAMGSAVEHLHPAFRTADDDPVYRLGQSTVDADAAVWRDRLGQFLKVSA
jgi:glycosyltransferase involved in cell wall biosynthesis